MPSINPDLLVWARKTAGFSPEEACRKLGLSATKSRTALEKLFDLETGKVPPSASQLENMAKKYRRPLVAFYLLEPPRKADLGSDFRKINKTIENGVNTNIDALLRELYLRQNLLKESLLGEDEESDFTLKFIDSMRISDGIENVKKSIVTNINFSLNEFYNHKSIDTAFSELRAKVEKVGIFVLLLGDLGSHHSSFEVEEFRGFSIADSIAPFVVINPHDAKGAWAFTLFHELTHLWLGQTGISAANNENVIEQFCDEVAGEILLPRENLKKFGVDVRKSTEDLAKEITKFATNHNISSTMVAYKLFAEKIITVNEWANLRDVYLDKWKLSKLVKKSEGSKGGPNYYVVTRFKLGNNLIRSVNRMILGGNLTSSKAARILGVDVKSVGKLTGLHEAKKFSSSRGNRY